MTEKNRKSNNITILLAIFLASILFYGHSVFNAFAVENSTRSDEIYIKDIPTDKGSVPSVPDPGAGGPWEQFWDSPDITLSPSRVIPGVKNKITVKIRNISMSSLNDVNLKLYYADANTSFPLSSSRLIPITTISNIHISALDSIEVKSYWTPPKGGNFFGENFWCIYAAAETVRDPITDDWAQWDNNIAVKQVKNNYLVPAALSGRNETHFFAGNPDLYFPVQTALWVERDLPAGWTAKIDTLEGVFFPVEPGVFFPVTITITPAPKAKIGETGIVNVSQVLLFYGVDGPDIFTAGQGVAQGSILEKSTIHLEPQSTPDANQVKYKITVHNYSETPDTLDYWAQVIKPNGAKIPPTPVLIKENGILPAGFEVQKTLTHNLPASWSAGDYGFTGSIGGFSDDTRDEDNFFFTLP